MLDTYNHCDAKLCFAMTSTKKETQIGVRLSKDLVDRAKKQADAEHRTVSQVVRMLLENWLRRGRKAA